jgi:TetR/AcrR family transcriptional regulator, regulator of cefoperazone and chloramphenicol sensitivity
MATVAKSPLSAPVEGRGDITRLALIHAALDQFGAKGFEASSTRAIAAAAGANLGSIAYHFGGKPGLRLACADHVVETIRAFIAPTLASAGPAPLTPAEARALLERVLAAFVAFMVVRPQAQSIARFVVREMFEPTEAFERVYAEAFAPMHERFCAVWAAATGAPADAPATKLATLAMLGQILYFRVARRVALRRLGWSDIGPREGEAIRAMLITHLHAALAAARKGAT